jgi:hypothetical protein
MIFLVYRNFEVTAEVAVMIGGERTQSGLNSSKSSSGYSDVRKRTSDGEYPLVRRKTQLLI